MSRSDRDARIGPAFVFRSLPTRRRLVSGSPPAGLAAVPAGSVRLAGPPRPGPDRRAVRIRVPPRPNPPAAARSLIRTRRGPGPRPTAGRRRRCRSGRGRPGRSTTAAVPGGGGGRRDSDGVSIHSRHPGREKQREVFESHRGGEKMKRHRFPPWAASLVTAVGELLEQLAVGCSTPFGVTDLVTTARHGRPPAPPGAQRLSASQTWSRTKHGGSIQ